jgi:hypothetical protein
MFCAGSRGKARIGMLNPAAWSLMRRLRKPFSAGVHRIPPSLREASRTSPASQPFSTPRCEAKPGLLVSGSRLPIFPSDSWYPAPSAWAFPLGSSPRSCAGTKDLRRCPLGKRHLSPNRRLWLLGSRKEAASAELVEYPDCEPDPLYESTSGHLAVTDVRALSSAACLG